MDLTLVDLEGLLPSAAIMVVSVTASTTYGKPLPLDVLRKTVEACYWVIELDSARKKSPRFCGKHTGRYCTKSVGYCWKCCCSKTYGDCRRFGCISKDEASWGQKEGFGWVLNCNVSIKCWLYSADGDISEYAPSFENACMSSFGCKVNPGCSIGFHEGRFNRKDWKVTS